MFSVTRRDNAADLPSFTLWKGKYASFPLLRRGPAFILKLNSFGSRVGFLPIRLFYSLPLYPPYVIKMFDGRFRREFGRKSGPMTRVFNSHFLDFNMKISQSERFLQITIERVYHSLQISCEAALTVWLKVRVKATVSGARGKQWPIIWNYRAACFIETRSRFWAANAVLNYNL